VTPDTVMIFAAGFGTRMMPLTRDRPKPMVKVAGQPLIDHALSAARQVNPRTIFANTHYKAEVLEQHLFGRDVQTIREDPDILDTGGGLKNALTPQSAPTAWTMNPDVIWTGPNPLQTALRHWSPDHMDALLVCVDPSRAHGTQSAGDFTIAGNGTLSRGSGVIFGGVQIIKTQPVANRQETTFSLNLVWDDLISAGRLFGVTHPGEWCDVGRPENIPVAEALLQREKAS